MAEQPGTKALLAEGGGGAETAHDTSLEFARALGAGAVFLFDTHGRLIVRTDRPREEGGRDFSGRELGVAAALAPDRGLRVHRGGEPRPRPLPGRVRARAAGRGDGARPQRRALRRLPHGRRARPRGGPPGRGRGRLPHQRRHPGGGAAPGGGGHDRGLPRSRARARGVRAERHDGDPARARRHPEPVRAQRPRARLLRHPGADPLRQRRARGRGAWSAGPRTRSWPRCGRSGAASSASGAVILLLSVPVVLRLRARPGPAHPAARPGRGGDRARQPRRAPAESGARRGGRAGPRLRGDAARAEGEGAARAAGGRPARARRGSHPPRRPAHEHGRPARQRSRHRPPVRGNATRSAASSAAGAWAPCTAPWTGSWTRKSP